MAAIDILIRKATVFVGNFDQRAQMLRKQIAGLSGSTQSNLPAEFVEYVRKYESWLLQMLPQTKNLLGHLVQAKTRGQITPTEYHHINSTLDMVNHNLGEIERTQNKVILHIIEREKRFILDIVQMAKRKLAWAHKIEQLTLKLREELRRSAEIVLKLLNRRPKMSVRRGISDIVGDRWDKIQVSNRRRKARKDWRIAEEKVNKQLLDIRDMHFYMCRDGIRKKIANYWMDKGLQTVFNAEKVRQEQRVGGDTVGPQYDKSIRLERVLIGKMRRQLNSAFSKLYYNHPLYNTVAEGESTNENYAIEDLNQFIEMLQLMQNLYQNQIELLSTGRLPYSSRFVNG